MSPEIKDYIQVGFVAFFIIFWVVATIKMGRMIHKTMNHKEYRDVVTVSEEGDLVAKKVLSHEAFRSTPSSMDPHAIAILCPKCKADTEQQLSGFALNAHYGMEKTIEEIWKEIEVVCPRCKHTFKAGDGKFKIKSYLLVTEKSMNILPAGGYNK